MRQVPSGKVTSYGAIARMLGYPHGARTVGWALHSIPEGSDVPWQRVVNAQGRPSLGEGGASVQRQLLEAEGIEFRDDGSIDLRRFGWEGLPFHIVDELIRD